MSLEIIHFTMPHVLLQSTQTNELQNEVEQLQILSTSQAASVNALEKAVAENQHVSIILIFRARDYGKVKAAFTRVRFLGVNSFW